MVQLLRQKEAVECLRQRYFLEFGGARPPVGQVDEVPQDMCGGYAQCRHKRHISELGGVYEGLEQEAGSKTT